MLPDHWRCGCGCCRGGGLVALVCRGLPWLGEMGRRSREARGDSWGGQRAFSGGDDWYGAKSMASSFWLCGRLVKSVLSVLRSRHRRLGEDTRRCDSFTECCKREGHRSDEEKES